LVDQYQSSSARYNDILMQHLTIDERTAGVATQIEEEDEPHFDNSLQRQQTPVLELKNYQEVFAR